MNSAVAQSLGPASIAPGIVEKPANVDPGTGLFGILTRPGSESRRTAFILINAGLLHRVGPFRLYVSIARQLAGHGFASIRLDQSGKGDSDAISCESLLQGNISNLRATMQYLERETGASRFVVCGLCSGADDILQAGARLESLAGVVLFDGYAPPTFSYYMRRYGPKLLSLRSWRQRLLGGSRSPRGTLGSLRNWGTPREMLARYRGLLDDDIRILAIYTGWPGNNYVYPSQLRSALGHRRSDELLTEFHLREATHLLHASEHRRQAVDAISDWANAAGID